MIIYSVTVNAEEEIAQAYQDWMVNEHLDEVIGTGCFTEYKFSRILEKFEEETGETYNAQYFAPNIESYERYKNDFAPSLQTKAKDKFGSKFVAFRTLLECIK